MPTPVRALQIETTSICNFRCDSCPLSMGEYSRPEKHMSLADFERVLDAFPTLEKIEMQGIGEVFLNPCALDLVRAAKRRGLQVHTYSNASKTRELGVPADGQQTESDLAHRELVPQPMGEIRKTLRERLGLDDPTRGDEGGRS